MNYVDWEDAKKGLVSRREFDKLHVLVAPHGMISACEVTYGRKHDSPVFCDMYGRIPHGDTGGHVLLDAAYLSRKNCRIIADSGREPVICPKKNSVPRGFNPMGKMLRWHRDDPCGFAKALRPAQPGGEHVFCHEGEVRRSRPCKDGIHEKAAACPKVHLLQPGRIRLP